MSFNKYINLQLLKDSLKMINPVVVTLLGAIIFTTLFTYLWFPPGSTNTPQQINVVPAPNNPASNPAASASAAIANALIFVSITLVGGLIFVFFIKYGLGKLMEFLLALVFGISGFSFSYMVLPPIINITIVPLLNWLIPYLPNSIGDFISINFWDLLFPLFCALIGILYFTGLTFLKNQNLHNGLMIYFGMSIGCVFGVLFEPVSLIFVLTALALYDIYAVFRGPLKNMFDRLDMKADWVESDNTTNINNLSDESQKTVMNASNSSAEAEIMGTDTTFQKTTKVRVPRQVKNPQVSNGFTLPVYATPYITIGLGDFAFFSILISKATYFAIKGDFLFLPAISYGQVDWLMIILPFIGLLVGCYATFVLLQKYEILPALPLPISCGLIGLFLAFLLQLL